MESFSHADLFFIISSIGTVLFMVLIGVILYQVIKILRLIRVILERVEAGSDRLAEDLSHVRAVIRQGGVISRFIGFFMPTGPRRRRKKTGDD